MNPEKVSEEQLSLNFDGDKKEDPAPKEPEKEKSAYEKKIEAEMGRMKNNPKYKDYSPEILRDEAKIIIHNRESDAGTHLYGDGRPNPN